MSEHVNIDSEKLNIMGLGMRPWLWDKFDCECLAMANSNAVKIAYDIDCIVCYVGPCYVG